MSACGCTSRKEPVADFLRYPWNFFYIDRMQMDRIQLHIESLLVSRHFKVPTEMPEPSNVSWSQDHTEIIQIPRSNDQLESAAINQYIKYIAGAA